MMTILRKLIVCMTLLISLSAHSSPPSESINRISVYINDDYPVINDIDLPGTVELHVYDLDLKDKATATINRMVKSRVGNRATSQNAQKLYQDEFSRLLNSQQWHPLYSMLQQGGVAIENTVRYGIKKVPAVVINDSAVIYGESSLKEAIRIFNHSRANDG